MRFLVCLFLLPLTLLAQTPLAFTREDPAAWRSGDEFVRPSALPDGTLFDLSFPANDKRRLAESPRRLDLSRYSSFRLRVDVVNPDTILEATLAFKSGNGWHTQNFTLHAAGPQHILLPRGLFDKEGSPGSWDKVDTLRLSFWPRSAGQARVRISSLDGFQDGVWVVDGQSAARNANETYTSRVTVWHLDRILRQLGIPHGVVPISRIDEIRNATLILLPYAPNLGDAELRILEERVKAGARLIVFENESPRLARLLGVELGPAQSSQSVGRFDQLVFNDSTRFPSRVYQHAWGFRDILPRDGAKVIATWHDARGQPVVRNAAILHRNGAWFNVAWRSGDVAAKGEVLLALLRTLSPASLAAAESFHRETRSPRAFQQRFGIFPASSRTARNMRQQAEKLLAGGLADLRSLDLLLQKAYAASREPWTPEIRGIWDQQGTGLYAGGWDETCRQLKAAGFNAVFPNLSTAGRAHYPSKWLPPSKTLEQYGDQLKAFTTAARKHGLQTHIWRISWKVSNPDPERLAAFRKAGRLMLDDNGKEIPWLSLSHPDNVQFEINCILEILERGDIDGIHLDYMRYPGKEADYGPAARKAFEKSSGKTVAKWPADVLGPRRAEYQRFRQQEVHNAVERISKAVKAAHPRVVLSIAVWGAWPDCAASQGQDWPVWAKKGWVDLIVPMNYSDNPAQVAGWLDLQRAQPGVASRLLPGLAFITTNAELSPVELLQQIELCRQRKTRGFILYRLDTSLPERLFPFLKAGLHSRPIP
jgi:uncharacterized lipoprotein YddW (UPF0748 family)